MSMNTIFLVLIGMALGAWVLPRFAPGLANKFG